MKNEKTQNTETGIKELEKQMEEKINKVKRHTREEIMHLEESFRAFKDVLKRVYEERKELERDRNFLLKKHKELISRIPLQKDRLVQEIKEKLVEPVQQKIKDNAALVAAAVKEDLTAEESKEEGKENVESTSIDELFELVVKSGKIKVSDAAKRFDVHEARIEEWAKILEDHGLIEIHYPAIGKPELRKKNE